MMPLSPLPEDTISLTARQVHTMTTQVLSETFDDVSVDGYNYTQNTMWAVLLFASVNRVSIKSACQTLCDAPSYNWVYTTLNWALLNGHTTDSLETRINFGYCKGKHRKHGARYLFLAVIGACRSSILSIAEEYRHRFGIEASYRIMNQVQL